VWNINWNRLLVAKTQTKLEKDIETDRVYGIGCKTDLRSSTQFTKPINLNYHSSANNDHVVKVQSMSLELVQSD